MRLIKISVIIFVISILGMNFLLFNSVNGGIISLIVWMCNIFIIIVLSIIALTIRHFTKFYIRFKNLDNNSQNLFKTIMYNNFSPVISVILIVWSILIILISLQNM